MIKDNKWGQIFVTAVSTVFSIILAILTWMSIFEHCATDIHVFAQPRTIEEHRPWLYIGMVLAGIIFLLVICYFISEVILKRAEGWNAVKRIIIVCSMVVCAFSIVWILFNDTLPKYDQKYIFREARIMAGYETGEYSTSSFELMPRNKGLVFVMAFLLRIFGDSMFSFRIFNVFGAVLLLATISLTVKKIWKNQCATIVTALFMMVYYPIVIYTCYLYGTLLSTAFGALGVYAIISFSDSRKKRYLFLMLFSFPFAIQMHQSAAIVMIAAMFYLLFHTAKKDMWKNLLYICLIVLMVFAFNKAADWGYETVTGVKLGDASPTLAYIYMGITAEDGAGGPGSQDGTFYSIYMENDGDGKATSRDAWNRIKKVAVEYASGERSLTFFIDKIKYQWLDPTFGSRRIIETNYVSEGEPANSEEYLSFYRSPLRSIAFKLAIVGMIIVYALNLFSAIYHLLKKEQNGLLFFIQILLLGGFVFQIFWESISRYCFSYFIWLLPSAAYGLVMLYQLLRDKVLKRLNIGSGSTYRKFMKSKAPQSSKRNKR